MFHHFPRSPFSEIAPPSFPSHHLLPLQSESTPFFYLSHSHETTTTTPSPQTRMKPTRFMSKPLAKSFKNAQICITLSYFCTNSPLTGRIPVRLPRVCGRTDATRKKKKSYFFLIFLADGRTDGRTGREKKSFFFFIFLGGTLFSQKKKNIEKGENGKFTQPHGKEGKNGFFSTC